MVAVKVRQLTLGVDGRGWGPAENTWRGRSRLSSGREDLVSLRRSIHRCWIFFGKGRVGGSLSKWIACTYSLHVVFLARPETGEYKLVPVGAGHLLFFPPSFPKSGVKTKRIGGCKLLRKANGEPPHRLAVACQGWADLLFGLPVALHVEVLTPALDVACSQKTQEGSEYIVAFLLLLDAFVWVSSSNRNP